MKKIKQLIKVCSRYYSEREGEFSLSHDTMIYVYVYAYHGFWWRKNEMRNRMTNIGGASGNGNKSNGTK